MTSFPKDIVIQANRELLPWKEEYAERYDWYVTRLLEACRSRCSVSARTGDFLAYFPKATRILLLQGHMGENYTRELLAIGLRRQFGENFVEYPRNDVLYASTDLTTKYGYGFSYGGVLEDQPIDRSTIEDQINSHAFDVIIFGKLGRDDWSIEQFPYADAIRRVYRHSELALLYGGDGMQDRSDPTNPYTQHLYRHLPLGFCFVRELL
jgi:hypothetical protein